MGREYIDRARVDRILQFYFGKGRNVRFLNSIVLELCRLRAAT